MATNTELTHGKTHKASRTPKGPARTRQPAAAKFEKKAGHRPGKTKPAARRESKLQTCLMLLGSTNGATIDELMAATGWQAHSVRGFLAGTVKKKLNLVLESSKAGDGVRRYRIAKIGA